MALASSMHVVWNKCLKKKVPDDVLPLVLSFTGTPTVDLPYRLGPVVSKSEFEKLQRRRSEVVSHYVNVGLFIRDKLCQEGGGNRRPFDWIPFSNFIIRWNEVLDEFGEFGVVFVFESDQQDLKNKEGRAGVCFLQNNSGGVFSRNKLFVVENWLDQIIEFVDDWRYFFYRKSRLKLWTMIEHCLLELLLELF
jgi:hypothetical protein